MIKREYLLIGMIILIGMGTAIGITSICKAMLTQGDQTTLAESETAAPRYLVYSEWDNGTTSLIHPWDIITIRLPENPTTGYQWEITRSDGLRLLDDSYIYPDPSGRMTGAGGWRRMTLVPETSGKESFSAVHRRSWESESGNEQYFSLQFNVQ
jgi:inhibitor of cysteine peptidase